jgi:glutamine synthetase
VDAADRAFLFRHAVKELASRRGLRATFMGKPFNGLAGSGMHAHVSLVDRSGANQFADVGAPDGLSDLARHFVAGLLQHAPASMALLCPNVNAFTRINEEDSLAPGAATWGMDNRTAYVRVPPERGAATRLEVRAADASANPYLVAAAILAAGLDGIERQLEVPAPLRPGDHVARTLPRDPATALRALQEDDRLVAALGPALVESFVALKAHEHRRFEQAVTDWEFEEFSWLL